MIFWIDAQLSPALAPWIAEEFGIESYSVQRLSHRDAADHENLFTLGNTSNNHMQTVLKKSLARSGCTF